MNSTEMLDPPAAPQAVHRPPTRRAVVTTQRRTVSEPRPVPEPVAPERFEPSAGSGEPTGTSERRGVHHPSAPGQEASPADAGPVTGRQHDTARCPTAQETWGHVEAAQNGDNAAFGHLYGQYAQIVYRYVLFRVSDHSLAEDITSETFLRALRRIASVSYQGKDVAAWFITIARNLILDHLKSSRNRLEIPTAELFDGTPNHRPESGPEQHVLGEVTQGQVLDCVRLLATDQRECIQLRFLQGLSVTETARRMHRNEGAVKALQHRAIRRLAQLLPEDVR